MHIVERTTSVRRLRLPERPGRPEAIARRVAGGLALRLRLEQAIPADELARRLGLRLEPRAGSAFTLRRGVVVYDPAYDEACVDTQLARACARHLIRQGADGTDEYALADALAEVLLGSTR
jgi:hypothetical protein